jgi:hypothetical protein
MGLLDSPIFGTPPEHTTEKREEGGKNLAVKAPEFDVTQYVKKLSVVMATLAAGAAGVLKAIEGTDTPPGILAACLGVVAVGILGVCLISAVDIAARAYVTRGQNESSDEAATPPDKKADAQGPAKPAPTTEPAPGGLAVGGPSSRMLAWLEGDDQPRLVLAVTGDGTTSKYLLSGEDRGTRKDGDVTVTSIEGRPAWHDGKEVSALRAVKLADWPEVSA